MTQSVTVPRAGQLGRTLALGVALASSAVQAAEFERAPGHAGGLSSASRLLVADDVTIAVPSRLIRVSWAGGYETATAESSQEDRFLIAVLADRSGRPGRPIALIRAGRVPRSVTGEWLNPPDAGGAPGRPEYAYAHTLEQPLDLKPGVYWLSIVNAMPGSADRRDWLWEASESGDGLWRRTGFDHEDWKRHPGGTAFTLDFAR